MGWAFPARLHSGLYRWTLGKVCPCLEAVHRHTHKHTSTRHTNVPRGIQLGRQIQCMRPTAVRFLPPHGESRLAWRLPLTDGRTAAQGRSTPKSASCFGPTRSARRTARTRLQRCNQQQTSRRAYPADATAALRCDRLELPRVLHRACCMLQLLHRACRIYLHHSPCGSPSGPECRALHRSAGGRRARGRVFLPAAAELRMTTAK